MLSSHSIISSSRTVRPCSPWGDWWIGHWRTTWSTVCSYVPHSQAAGEAIPHLYKLERKRPTPVRRWLSWSHAVLGRAVPGWWVPMSGMKVRSLVMFSNYYTFHWWPAQFAARMLLLSDELWAVRRVQIGVSIWVAVRSHRVTRWELGGADVQAPWRGVLETE